MMQEEYTMTSLLEEINRLNAENASLRNLLACLEEMLASIKEISIVKEQLGKQTEQQGFVLFQKHFLENNDIVELNNSTDAITQLLTTQHKLAKKVKKQLNLFTGFERLHLMYEKLSTPEGKLMLITEILKKGTADIDGQYLDTVIKTAKEYTSGIFRRLREHEYDSKLMKLYVVGGGGCLIRNFADYDRNRVVINEDICATAKGYEYMALVTLHRKGGAV